VTKRNDVRENKLTVALVVADMRQALSNLRESPKRGKVAHGAFVAANGDDSEEAPEPRRQKGRPRGTPRGQKRARETGDEGTRPTCPACDYPHLLVNCYSVFPEKRHEGYKPNTLREEAVKKRILLNTNGLADQIRKIKLERSA
jgi:hypothetical protein